MIEITVLGSGASTGVPVLACDCSICKSDDQKNKRLRSALLIKTSSTTVLVDCGFDIRTQLLAANVDNIDAVILTHAHADHIMGLDHLRTFYRKTGKAVPIYTDATTFTICHFVFGYMLTAGYIKINKLDYYDALRIGNIDFQFFRQFHAEIDSLGFKIKNFVYSNDVIRFPEESQKYLYGLDQWVVDCSDYQDTKVHMGLETVLKLDLRYKSKSVFLTNLGHELEYSVLRSILPSHIEPCFDGIKILV